MAEGSDPGTGARSAPVPGEEGLGQGSQAVRLGCLGAEGKILVVDDNEIELGVLRIVLEAAGFEVQTLDSVFDLSIAIKRDRPDVILLDVMMPALSGDRAAAILKQHGFARDIPVILHSSKDAAELEKIATRAGVQGFVSKTGDFDRLLAEIRRISRG